MTSKTISNVAGPGTLLVSDAENAINQKAVELGPARTGGSSVSLLENAGTGFRKRYRGCDIYYSEATGAHEVHGAIREKYRLFGEADGSLGLPTSDEQDAQERPEGKLQQVRAWSDLLVSKNRPQGHRQA